ncbi:MAG: WD40/YVTN/BNR-like repeat-containing protein [Candidatus Kapaibacterium sp.]
MTIQQTQPFFTTWGVLFLVFFLPSLLSAQSEWEHANGSLSGVRVTGIMFASDGTPIVISGHGIYRVEEITINDELTPVGVRVDSNLTGSTIDSWGKKLFVATEKGIYCSNDDGFTWTLHIVPMPNSPMRLSAAKAAEGFVVVPNVGQNTFNIYDSRGWFVETRRFPSLGGQLTITPSGTLIWLQLSMQPVTMYQSHDTGRSWQKEELTGDVSRRLVFGVSALSDSILAISSDSGLFVSVDAGHTWSFSDLYAYTGLRFTVDGTLYAIGFADSTRAETRIMRSTDTGKTWVYCQKFLTNVGFIYTSPVDPHGVAYMLNHGQLVRAKDCSSSWQVIREGFLNLNFKQLITDGVRFYTTIERRGDVETRRYIYTELLRSDNAGTTWEKIRDTVTSIAGLDSLGNLYIRSDSVGHVDSTSTTYRSIWRSSDQGNSWRSVYNEPTYLPMNFSVQSARSGTVVITARHIGIPRDLVFVDVSTDSGNSFMRLDGWGEQVEGLEFQLMDVAVLPSGKVVIAAGWYDSARALQQAIQYQFDPVSRQLQQLQGPLMDKLSVGSTGLLYGWLWAGREGLYRSDDEGKTWNQIEVPANYVREFSEKPGGFMFLVGYAKFQSRDSGKTWTQIIRQADGALKQAGNFDYYVPAIVLPNGTVYDSVHVDREDEYRGDQNSYHYFTFARSLDGGETWDFTFSSPELDLKYVSLMAIDNDGTLLVGTQEDGIYRIKTENSPLSITEKYREVLKLLKLDLE